MKASVGDVLLFKIDDRDFGTWVPLLVTHVNFEDETVAGTLFFSWDHHRKAEWISKKVFWGISDMKWFVPVSGAKRGEKLGEWKFTPLQLALQEQAKAKQQAAPLKGVKK